MAHMERACEECTEHCIMMHKRGKNPEAVATTFFKVMIGKDYNKVLFLPPKFARSLKKEVPEVKTCLVDSNSGEKWKVEISNIDDSMAFRKGWDEFALHHELQVGDLLVFHYIKIKKHFVVLMYGKSGCPELRHQMKIPEKNNKPILDGHIPSNVNSNGKHYLNESSSEFEGSQQKKKRNIKENDAMVPPDENTTNTDHLAASLSQLGTLRSDIERGQSSEPLVRKTNCDTMVFETQIATSGPDKEMSQRFEPLDRETGTTVKHLCKLDNNDEKVDDECRKMEPKANPYFMSQRCEPLVCETGTPVEQTCRLPNDDANLDDEYRETMPKVNPDSMRQRCEPLVCKTGITVKQFSKPNNDDANSDDDYTKTKPKVNPQESEGASKSKVEAGGSGEETQNDLRKRLETKLEATKKQKTSTAMPSDTICNNSKLQTLGNSNIASKQMETIEKEPVKVKEIDTSGSRLHKGGNPYPSSGMFPKPTGSKLRDTKKVYCNSPKVENDTEFVKVKPEPVDDDEAPPYIPTNTTFSAVMSSYKYIELPDKVKLKKVIFLRNGSELWPVLFQSKFGLKALTHSWEVFAKERGIMPGDKCDFVLESDPSKDVFSVHISR